MISTIFASVFAAEHVAANQSACLQWSFIQVTLVSQKVDWLKLYQLYRCLQPFSVTVPLSNHICSCRYLHGGHSMSTMERKEMNQNLNSRIINCNPDRVLSVLWLQCWATSLCIPHRIVVRIDSWEAGSQYPNGHFVRSIGPIGNIETETATVLIEHCLSTSAFSKALLEGTKLVHCIRHC